MFVVFSVSLADDFEESSADDLPLLFLPDEVMIERGGDMQPDEREQRPHRDLVDITRSERPSRLRCGDRRGSVKRPNTLTGSSCADADAQPRNGPTSSNR